MSDGMTDETRRDRLSAHRIDNSEAVKAMNDALKRGSRGPIMGGLITDPLPAKVRKLEERVTALETFALKMLQYMDSQNAK